MVHRRGHERHAQTQHHALADVGFRQGLEDLLAKIDSAYERGRACAEVLAFYRRVAQKGNQNAAGDASVEVLLCEAALRGAALNVYLNTRAIEDQEFVDQSIAELKDVLSGSDESDDLYRRVRQQLCA